MPFTRLFQRCVSTYHRIIQFTSTENIQEHEKYTAVFIRALRDVCTRCVKIIFSPFTPRRFPSRNVFDVCILYYRLFISIESACGIYCPDLVELRLNTSIYRLLQNVSFSWFPPDKWRIKRIRNDFFFAIKLYLFYTQLYPGTHLPAVYRANSVRVT